MWKSQVDFSTAGKELTPTMKMARHAILKKYANEVGTLAYGDDSDDYDDDDQGDLDDGSRVMILIIVCHDIFQKYAVEVRTVLHDNDYGDRHHHNANSFSAFRPKHVFFPDTEILPLDQGSKY